MFGETWRNDVNITGMNLVFPGDALRFHADRVAEAVQGQAP